MPRHSLVLPITSFRRLTRRTRLLALDVSRADFSFRPGQAVALGRHGQTAHRPYSIANAPEDARHTGVLEFLVGLDAHGRLGAHLLGVARGDLVDIEGPFGGFDLPALVPGAPLLLVAGGTGIAPLRSLMRAALAERPTPPVHLVYSARSSENLAFGSELRRLARDGHISMTTTVTGPSDAWTGKRGRVTRTLLADCLSFPRNVRCAVCGPPAFVDGVKGILEELGVPRGHVATERW